MTTSHPHADLVRRLFAAFGQQNREEIVAIMRHAGDTAYGLRMRALIVLLWRMQGRHGSTARTAEAH